MGAARLQEEGCEDAPTDLSGSEGLGVAPDVVEVRRHAGVAAGVGLLACGVAIAYLARATQTGTAIDWILAGAMGALGGFWLAGFVDARTPLLVADAHGVRIRLGRSWRGLAWSAVRHVEHTPRRGLLHDGRIVVVPHNPELVEAGLSRYGRRHTALARRLYGSVLAVPLGISTRVVGAGDDLAVALERAAAGTTRVVAPVGRLDAGPESNPGSDPESNPGSKPGEAAAEDPEDREDSGAEDAGSGMDGVGHRVPDPRPRLAAWIIRLSALVPATGRDRSVDPEDRESDPDGEPDGEPVVEPVVEPGGDGAGVPVVSVTPLPLRDPASARRTEVRRDVTNGPGNGVDEDIDTAPEGRALRRPGSVNLVEETQVWGDRVRPIARAGASVDPLLVEDFAPEPAAEPVVGPEIVAARTRLGLGVDQLAERTRIRPHVIESIEVDDFEPCGGDFYARGHLRTLARILGIDVAPLLASYDERYAHAPINPRRVFEAELATGANGSIRGTRGGPNWSVLVAVVMALVLCWSIARLVMDTPAELRSNAPVLNGSGGPNGAGAAKVADPVAVQVAAPAGGSQVVVRDGSGEIVFKGNLAVGDVRDLEASPPVRVQASDGAVTVSVAGSEPRPVGEAGVAGQGTFVTD